MDETVRYTIRDIVREMSWCRNEMNIYIYSQVFIYT